MHRLLIGLTYMGLTLLMTDAFAQTNKNEGFDIMLPEGWYDESDVDLRENLEKYELSDEEVAEMMRTHHGSVPTVVFMKYDRREHAGVIPTIQVNLRPYPFRTDDEFKAAMEQSTVQMAEMLTNFELVEPMTELNLDGRKALHFVSNFEMQLADGQVQAIRSWTYAVPVGDYFYQINYSDFEGDDCAETYQKVTDSLRF